MSDPLRERLDALAALLEYPYDGETALQEEYTATFDMTAACSLNLGWHLYGDTPDRAAFLVELRDALQRARVSEGHELPDHLATVLPLLGREDPASARVLAARVAPAIAAVRHALEARQSVYASLLAAVEAAVVELHAANAAEVR